MVSCAYCTIFKTPSKGMRTWKEGHLCAIYSSVIKRILPALLLSCCLSAVAPAEGAPPARRGYEALRDAMYNSETLPRLEALYRDALAALDASDLPEADLALWRGRIEYMIARGYQARDEKARAVLHYEAGLAALEALAPERATSESWRMTSECISQLCLLKPVGFVVVNGPKVSTYAERALAMDPKNAAAQVIIAASKIYPPAMLGGNPKRGIELMHAALSMGTAERDDLFNIYSGIGLAYGKLKNAGEARRWLAMALELYPGNVYARTEYEKLEEP